MSRLPHFTSHEICAFLDINPRTLRAWKERGHIRRYYDGYDIQEIRDYLANRDQAKVTAADQRWAKIRHADRPVVA